MLLKFVIRCCRKYQRDFKWKYRTEFRSFHNEVSSGLSPASSGSIKTTLRQHNVNFQEGHACIVINCPICDSGKQNDAKLYINKTTGLFVCPNCRHTGPWDVLSRVIGPKKSAKTVDLKAIKQTLHIEEDFSGKWTSLVESCQNISELSEDSYNNLITNYAFPKVTQSQMSQLGCYYKDVLSSFYFPLITIGNKIAGYKCLSISPVLNEKTVPSISANGLIIYKERKAKTDGTAVVVPSVEDLLALIAERSANTVICLPYGLQHLPLQILPILEPFKKLILWFDNDSTSWDSARHFAKKLNEKRCFFVRPTNHQPRPKVAAVRGYNLKNIIQEAQPIWHKSITTFHSLREDILSDLQNIDKVQGVKWNRYPTLNRILKGHRRGEFTVLTGPTGSGKTTFISEYSLDLAMQGVNTLWGSFEIRNTRLARTMLQQMAGVSLEENLQDFNTYADAFEKLPLYFMTFHGQQNLAIVMEAVEHATYVHDIAHVIIDNVQFMMGMSESSKHLDSHPSEERTRGGGFDHSLDIRRS
ncbi:twinkle protein, mitochondrial isoform X2 [Diachasma alloeum]|uniref:twinkle protein, mitochondrial isoform X2 n=1 Tax=Diachasma alloeum TaxID=454923 RepID=UPI0007381EFF|nr:twinkle protein, mitochondrial isoform X2 [Diachasma alloeum]